MNMDKEPRYEGERDEDGEPCGEGRMEYDRIGDFVEFYEGQWKGGKWHGKGVLQLKFHRWEGEWKEGNLDGQGTETDCGAHRPYEDRRLIYKGEYKDGRRHGQGTCYFHLGDVEYRRGLRCYEGEWENGFRHGRGVLRFRRRTYWKYGQRQFGRRMGKTRRGVWKNGIEQNRWIPTIHEGYALHIDTRRSREYKNLQTKEEFSNKVARLREEFQGRSSYSEEERVEESPKSIYILKINPRALSNEDAKAIRTFPWEPPEKTLRESLENILEDIFSIGPPPPSFPALVWKPLGFVYVGLTDLWVEDRFAVHQSREGKASRIAKLGLLDGGSYDLVGEELTEQYGFKQVGWRDKKPEKLQSWVAWNFYKMGYWVWGSHHHGEEDFLGKGLFE